jgi:hypothetical protein
MCDGNFYLKISYQVLFRAMTCEFRLRTRNHPDANLTLRVTYLCLQFFK